MITADNLNGERLLEAAGIETNTVKRTGVMRMTARTISMRRMQSESEQPTGFRIGPDGEVEVLTRAETAATELDELTERERVMARLAKNIGRGRDVIYHGTRALPEVMRAGKLIPPDLAERAVFFTRSPEVAAYFACLRGEKKERRSPGVLILDRSSLRQCYRLEPNRYDHFHGRNEREEAVWGRIVSFRRHLVGVVSEANVSELLGAPKRRYLPRGFASWPAARRREFNERELSSGRKLVAEGRAAVRDLIVRERQSASEASCLTQFYVRNK